MLYIFVGKFDFNDNDGKYILDIDKYFNSFKQNSWFDYWADYLISDIDNSKLIKPDRVDSPWLGNISVNDISGGVKQLIMMKHINSVVYNGDNLGDNCWFSLLLLSKFYDIVISLSYFPKFEWFPGSKVCFINNGIIVESYDEYTDARFELMLEAGTTYQFNSIKWPIELNSDMFKFEIDF